MKKIRNHIKYSLYLSFFLLIILTTILLSAVLVKNSYSQQTISTIFAITENSQLIPYENPNLGIKLLYLSDWIIRDSKNDVKIISPPESNFDTYPEYLSIIVVPLSNSFEYFVNLMSDERKLLKDFSPIESQKNPDGTLHSVIYTFKDPNLGETKAMDILVSNGEKFYMMQYFAEPAKYDLYLPIIGAMIGEVLLSIE